jgi:RNA polymerase sigma factor (sigma-70 family)
MWADFCASRYAYIQRYFLRQVESQDDAADLTQEVFAEITAQPEMPRDLEGYVYIVARNLLARYWRKKRIVSTAIKTVKVRHVAEVTNVSASGYSPAVSGRLIQKQFREVMSIAEAHLPAKSVQVVQMRYAEGLSTEQVARKIGCSIGALHKRLQRATKTLRRIVRESEDLCDY